MGELHLREYRSADAEAMYALDLVCFAEPFRFSRRAMRAFAEARGAVSLLATLGEKELAGFVIVQEDGRRGSRYGYVVTLDVALAWRGRGVATNLMREAERRLAARGTRLVTLHVYSGNQAAIRFYEREGYQPAGVEPGFYGVGLDAVVYSKLLQ